MLEKLAGQRENFGSIAARRNVQLPLAQIEEMEARARALRRFVSALFRWHAIRRTRAELASLLDSENDANRATILRLGRDRLSQLHVPVEDRDLEFDFDRVDKQYERIRIVLAARDDTGADLGVAVRELRSFLEEMHSLVDDVLEHCETGARAALDETTGIISRIRTLIDQGLSAGIELRAEGSAGSAKFHDSGADRGLRAPGAVSVAAPTADQLEREKSYDDRRYDVLPQDGHSSG